jgi:hypothetical protein
MSYPAGFLCSLGTKPGFYVSLNQIMFEIMKSFYIKFFLVSTILTATACSPLHKTQKKAASDYFHTIARFPEYPRELKHFSAKVRMNRVQMYPGTFDTDSLMIENLVNAYKIFQEETCIGNGLDSVLMVMDNYITQYFSMTPEGFWLYKGLSSGASIFGQFFGFGPLVQQVTNQTDRSNIINVGGKKIRNHIIHEKSQVRKTAEVLKQYADSILSYKLEPENELLKINYRRFLEELHNKPNPYEYYAIYNEIFMRNYRLLHHTENLARQLKQGSEQLIETHTELCNELKERKRLEGGIPELYKLLQQMNEIQKTIKTLKQLEETAPETIRIIPLEQSQIK